MKTLKWIGNLAVSAVLVIVAVAIGIQEWARWQWKQYNKKEKP